MAVIEMKWIGSEDLAVISGVASYSIGGEKSEVALSSFDDALKIDTLLWAANHIGKLAERERIARRIRDVLGA